MKKNSSSFTNGIICFILLLIFTGAKKVSELSSSTYLLLCLGDSYTIGESVTATENFPNQTVQLLQKAHYDFEPPEIIAKTGWTTNELQNAMNNYSFKKHYDFVTLLIGVNNQYRGESLENYKQEFESLLHQAIQFAGNNAGHVIVLSIPDWGVTPFAKGRNRDEIAKEIDEYNLANKSIAEKNNVHYIDITPGTRKASNDQTLLASDGLHPSGKEYAEWAEKISSIIKSTL
jgi:lysophospholipase L1-like esterase